MIVTFHPPALRNEPVLPPSLPDEPDVPRSRHGSVGRAGSADSFAAALGRALAAAAGLIDRAGSAERAFASGRGGLQEMVVSRAQADVTLALAAAAASRTTQALSTILGMQI